ncbi:MAG: hypothetical protein BRC58_00635 [Cyanobacteria bacterium QS_8_64_29]|nr:MAG: hypothetical protein BRC58_00635 [Cyanobacteria bacterium QS_8_64_29]
MSLAQDFRQDSVQLWGTLKSFALWNFTLLVCLLVAGFPLVAIAATVGLFLAMTLHALVPASAVLMVAGSLIGSSVIAIALSSAILTLKGIHLQRIPWLHWLNGKAAVLPRSQYGACQLACDLQLEA